MDFPAPGGPTIKSTIDGLADQAGVTVEDVYSPLWQD
jgi:hypothetical protein